MEKQSTLPVKGRTPMSRSSSAPNAEITARKISQNRESLLRLQHRKVLSLRFAKFGAAIHFVFAVPPVLIEARFDVNADFGGTTFLWIQQVWYMIVWWLDLPIHPHTYLGGSVRMELQSSPIFRFLPVLIVGALGSMQWFLLTFIGFGLCFRSRSSAEARRIEQDSCIDCGYRLQGLPANRCPECGWSFGK